MSSLNRVQVEVERWCSSSNNKANIKIKEYINEDSIILFTIGDDKQTFTFSYPTTYPSKEPFQVFSEEETLENWTSEMMDFCSDSRTVEEILNFATNKFLNPENEAEGEGEGDGDDFLGDDDFPAIPVSSNKKKETDELDAKFTGTGNKQGNEALMRELRVLLSDDTKKFGYSATPLGDNIYHWHIKLFGFDKGTPLQKDLEKLESKGGINHVLLEMKFPSDYPFAPPFVRVVKPRFQFHTGHVTIGGSICMELLTRSGWTPANSIESIIVQIRTEMIIGGARLDVLQHDYTEEQALEAFNRVARQHGWQ
eukprot:TRINITY_DN1605_c0_g1_i1.p1 TRINITY_DN1605_c0_g1~~TRINITY_DN1605_c0_g1_i1.p1  ORF type:complete len:310 (+),score=123.67 TRINITY_DN1605_c0_g1_i1:69-998(+)